MGCASMFSCVALPGQRCPARAQSTFWFDLSMKTNDSDKSNAVVATDLNSPAQDANTRNSALIGDLRTSGYEEGQAKLAPEKGGREIYENALGKTLGSKLFALVQENLSLEKIQGYSNTALKGILDTLSTMAQDGQPGQDQKQLVEKVMGEVSKEILAAADSWLETEQGQAFAGKITSYVEGHPRTVVSVALLAGVGAIVANMDLPEFTKKFNLSKGLSGSVFADPAGIRDFALNSVGASLRYHREKLTLRGQVEHNFDSGTSGEIGASYQGGNSTYSTMATIDQEGLLTAQVGAKWVHDIWASAEQASGGKGGIDGSTAKVDAKSGQYSTEATVRHERDQGISLELGQEFVAEGLGGAFQDQRLSVNQSTGYNLASQTGTLAAGIALEKPDLLRTDIRAAFDISNGGQLGGGNLNLRRESLTGSRATYDLGVDFGDEQSVNLGASRQFGDFSTVGGKLRSTFQGDLRHLSAYYGYEVESFQKAFFEVSRDVGAHRTNIDTFMGSYERVIGTRFAGKLTSRGTFEDGHFTSGSVGLLGGYRSHLGKEPVTYLGGVEQSFGPDGSTDTAIKLGVEVRNIPIVITTDPDFEHVTIGISIGFDLF